MIHTEGGSTKQEYRWRNVNGAPVTAAALVFVSNVRAAAGWPEKPVRLVMKMNGLILKAMKAVDAQAFMKRDVLDVVASTPGQLRAQFAREIAKYAEVIAAGNIKIQ